MFKAAGCLISWCFSFGIHSSRAQWEYKYDLLYGIRVSLMVHVFILIFVRQSSQWINTIHVISKVSGDLTPFISTVSAASKAVFDPRF